MKPEEQHYEIVQGKTPADAIANCSMETGDLFCVSGFNVAYSGIPKEGPFKGLQTWSIWPRLEKVNRLETNEEGTKTNES